VATTPARLLGYLTGAFGQTVSFLAASASLGAANAGNVILANASGQIDNSFLLVPTVVTPLTAALLSGAATDLGAITATVTSATDWGSTNDDATVPVDFGVGP
jgi:hypothetical protein